MKILKVYKENGEIEEYRTGERAVSNPQEFVKTIVYKDGNYTVCFSDRKDWFKTFTNMKCEYMEFNEMEEKSNRYRLI